MTVVPTEPVMSEVEAEGISRRIWLMAGAIRDGLNELHVLVAQARAGSAHVALGYRSWTAYLAATLGKEPLRLDREERQQLVGYLAGEGMSTRAIAPIVGASQRTVANDVSKIAHVAESSRSTYDCHACQFHIVDDSGDADGFREAVDDHEQMHAFADEAVDLTDEQFEDALTAARELGDASRSGVASHFPELTDAPALTDEPDRIVKLTGPQPVSDPRPAITGLDGKTYGHGPRHTTSGRRRPLPPAFRDALGSLRAAQDGLDRILADGRFPAEGETLAAAFHEELLEALAAQIALTERLARVGVTGTDEHAVAWITCIESAVSDAIGLLDDLHPQHPWGRRRQAHLRRWMDRAGA